MPNAFLERLATDAESRVYASGDIRLVRHLIESLHQEAERPQYTDADRERFWHVLEHNLRVRHDDVFPADRYPSAEFEYLREKIRAALAEIRYLRYLSNAKAQWSLEYKGHTIAVKSNAREASAPEMWRTTFTISPGVTGQEPDVVVGLAETPWDAEKDALDKAKGLIDSNTSASAS